LLVGSVAVRPLGDGGAVGGGAVEDVEHFAGVAGADAVEAAAGVDELPLLVVVVAAGPLGDAAAVVGGEVEHVQRLAAVAVEQHVERVGVDGGGGGAGGVENDHATRDQGQRHRGRQRCSGSTTWGHRLLQGSWAARARWITAARAPSLRTAPERGRKNSRNCER
jgi:hypothetical protein